MQQITTQELKEKINSNENFIVDFYADWCGPCKIMMKNLERLDEKFSNEPVDSNPKIYKFNVDTDKDFTLSQLGIRSIPTIKFFNEGKEYYSKAGVMQLSEMMTIISNK